MKRLGFLIIVGVVFLASFATLAKDSPIMMLIKDYSEGCEEYGDQGCQCIEALTRKFIAKDLPEGTDLDTIRMNRTLGAHAKKAKQICIASPVAHLESPSESSGSSIFASENIDKPGGVNEYLSKTSYDICQSSKPKVRTKDVKASINCNCVAKQAPALLKEGIIAETKRNYGDSLTMNVFKGAREVTHTLKYGIERSFEEMEFYVHRSVWGKNKRNAKSVKLAQTCYAPEFVKTYTPLEKAKMASYSSPLERTKAIVQAKCMEDESFKGRQYVFSREMDCQKLSSEMQYSFEDQPEAERKFYLASKAYKSSLRTFELHMKARIQRYSNANDATSKARLEHYKKRLKEGPRVDLQKPFTTVDELVKWHVRRFPEIRDKARSKKKFAHLVRQQCGYNHIAIKNSPTRCDCIVKASVKDFMAKYPTEGGVVSAGGPAPYLFKKHLMGQCHGVK